MKNFGEKELEALVSLVEINQRYNHEYYCLAEEVQKKYLSEIKPILEAFALESEVILKEMEKREEIYKEQVDCRNSN